MMEVAMASTDCAAVGSGVDAIFGTEHEAVLVIVEIELVKVVVVVLYVLVLVLVYVTRDGVTVTV